MKKNSIMKNVLTITLTIFSFLTIFSQNEVEAKKLLDDVSFKMKTYDNIYIDFDYTLVNVEADVEQISKGDVILEGEKYVVNLFDTTMIFDGELNYMIVPENEEVNISKLNDENNEVISPSSLLTFYQNGYTFLMGKNANINGKTIQYVVLIPIDSNSEVRSVEVGIDMKNLHINSVREIGNNETYTVISVTDIKTNQKLNDQTFIFDENKFINENYTINR